MAELDRLIHEPARLRIVTVLANVAVADFNFLVTTLGITKGNLSSHMGRLEQGGYVEITKGFNGKVPLTTYRLTDTGRKALEAYWSALEEIRALGEKARKEAPKLRLRMDLGNEVNLQP